MNISKDLAISLLLLIVLFTPTLNPYIYIVVLSVSIIALNISKAITFNTNSKIFKIVFLIFIIVTFSSLLRSIIYLNTSLRDISELGRVFLLLLLAGYYQSITNRSFIKIYNVFFLYTVVNLTIVYFQLSGGNSLTSLIEIYYTSEVQKPYTSLRATGMGTGPGDQGIMFVLLFAYFFSHFIFGTRKLLSGALSFFCAYIVWTTQSQTSFIGLSLSAFIVIITNLKLGNYKQKITSVYITLLSFFIILSTSFLSKFIHGTSYLSTLFTQGLERHSYTHRIDKWQDAFNLANERYSGYFLGWGKEYFGTVSSALDNEYVYIFLIYGPLIFFIFLSFLWFQFLVILKLYNKDYDEAWLMSIAILPSSILMSWPSGVFTNLKTGFIVFFFLFFLQNKHLVFKRNLKSKL